MIDPGPDERPDDDLTELLNRLSDGKGADVGPFNPGEARPEDVYALIHLVVRRVRRPRANQSTAETTDLVHRIYERTMLRPPNRNGDLEHTSRRWTNRQHFVHFVVRMTINLLIDDYRRGRGPSGAGDGPPVPIDQLKELAAPEPDPENAEQALLLECLDRYLHLDPRGATVVTLRYFMGLTAVETSRAIECCKKTVERDWRSARAWLFEEMTRRRLETEGPP